MLERGKKEAIAEGDNCKPEPLYCASAEIAVCSRARV